MKKDNRNYILISLLILVIVVETIVIFIQKNKLENQGEADQRNNVNLIDLRYGDSFDRISVVDVEGKETTLKCEENNILFYLSASCTSCGDVLRFADRLQKVFKEDCLNIVFLWSDSIPLSLVEEYNIEVENCYHVGDETVLNTPTPTAYVLDKQGNIVYYNSDIKMVIEKIYMQTIEIYNNEEQLRLNANKYLMEEFEIFDFKKQQVIYFCMEGCPDCEAADAVLNNDTEKEKRNVYYLYKYDDIDPAHFKDDFALFRLIYGIEWYPSFVVLESEEEYRIVGEVPVETLLKVLEQQE